MLAAEGELVGERTRDQVDAVPDEAVEDFLFSAVPQPAWIYDVESLRFLDVNPAAVAFYGYTRDEFRTMRLSDLVPAGTAAAVDGATDDASATRRHQKADGSVVDVEVRAQLVDRGGRPAMFALCIPTAPPGPTTTDLYDAVTGLAGPVLFADRVERAIARAGRAGAPPAVVAIEFGTEPTGAVLVASARELEAGVRRADTVARAASGGFSILCEEVRGETEVVELVARLTARLPVAVSAGAVVIDSDTSRADTVVRQSLDACRHAAQRGGGRCEVFQPPLRRRASGATELEAALWQALERDELRLAYQPIVSLADQEVVGAEALVRWQHPELGLLGPGRFVPVAEESDLIIALGEWTLVRACRQLGEWQRWRPGLTVSINMSARQLGASGLAGTVAAALAAANVEPATVYLEITETSVMDEESHATAILPTLKALGPRLAIDDFGTGYSSLAYLKRLPVDVLKVDQSFVASLGDDSGSDAIVAAVIDLARTLGLSVVAEGVEDEEQLRRLRALGCDRGQGYHFARPMAPEGFGMLLHPDASGGAAGASSPALDVLRRRVTPRR